MNHPSQDVVIVEVDENHAFEYTPFGIVPIGSGSRQVGPADTTHGGAVAPQVQQVARPKGQPLPAQTAGRFVLDSGRPLTGREIMQAAKSRIREIDRALKSVPDLQRERAQLQALVLAASSSQPKKRRKAEVQ
jgi:hypothetical protein